MGMGLGWGRADFILGGGEGAKGGGGWFSGCLWWGCKGSLKLL